MEIKVKKYTKKKNGLYHILFENGKSLDLYEEVILKYNLLVKKLDVVMMHEIECENNKWEVYYTALKYIKYKARTVYEVKSYLLKKEYSKEFIDDAINRLTKQGYLDDLGYAKSFLNMKIFTTTHGPNRVRNDLNKRGVDSKIIEEVMKEYNTDIEKEKVEKIVTKKINSNHSKSARILRQKIMNELIRDGFSKSIVSSVLSNVSIKDSEDFVKREYDKIYRRLSRKYTGDELKYRIRQKMYQKGISYDDFD